MDSVAVKLEARDGKRDVGIICKTIYDKRERRETERECVCVSVNVMDGHVILGNLVRGIIVRNRCSGENVLLAGMKRDILFGSNRF